MTSPPRPEPPTGFAGSLPTPRDGRRLRWNLPVRIDHEGTVYAGSTEDVSTGGACLRAPVPLRAGAVVEVTDLQSGRSARCKVVWADAATPGGSDGYRLGVQLLTPAASFWGFDLTSRRAPLGA